MSDSLQPAPLTLILIWARERALGDLAVDGGPGQAGPGENGFQADDTVWCEHGCAASCRVFLTTAETRQSEDLLLCKSDLERRSAVA